jgi:hypothetical protein
MLLENAHVGITMTRAPNLPQTLQRPFWRHWRWMFSQALRTHLRSFGADEQIGNRVATQASRNMRAQDMS